MSNFSFFNYYSYYTKEFYIKHCFLLYTLVIALLLPEENKDKAKYLTKFYRFL